MRHLPSSASTVPSGPYERALSIPDNTESYSSNAAPMSERRHHGVVPSAPRHKFAWESPTSLRLKSQIERVAAVNSTLLLLGESGTGKSTIARMVHERSARKNQPFVTVNCASLPRDLIDAELFGHAKGAFTGAVGDRVGRVEAAAGGTLFLDEIGDLPIELQPKLLTFLQERSFYRLGSNKMRSVDVRVISATHADLLERSKTGLFRRDLFFRLAVLRITVPTLAQRRDEIGTMARRILTRVAKQNANHALELSDNAIQQLQQYHWPGNIRELENVIENAVAFCETNVIQPTDLLISNAPMVPSPTDATATSPFLGKSLADLEKEAIIVALEHSNGNKAQTARSLGISLRSIYNKMRKHGLVIAKSLSTSD